MLQTSIAWLNFLGDRDCKDRKQKTNWSRKTFMIKSGFIKRGTWRKFCIALRCRTQSGFQWSQNFMGVVGLHDLIILGTTSHFLVANVGKTRYTLVGFVNIMLAIRLELSLVQAMGRTSQFSIDWRSRCIARGRKKLAWVRRARRWWK